MKKIFILIALLTLSVSAQNLQWIDTVGTTEKTIRIGNFDNNTQRGSWYYGRLPVEDATQASFVLPSGYTGNFVHFGITDTLYGYNATNGAKDTLVFDLNGMAKSITVGTKDTGTIGSSAGLIDSLSVDVYIPLLDSWTTLTNGLFRLYDGQYTSGAVVVPGNGYYKEYYIVGEYIDQIRVRWNYPLSPAKTNRKVPLTIYGSN